MKNFGSDDTICAISTAVGGGGISIVRLSGKLAVSIVNAIFRGSNLTTISSHTIHYGYVVDGDDVVDEVMVSVMRAPRTYTREDVVEINCHGGSLVTSRVLSLCVQGGARPAEAGEFTKRAFLNGRIDLTQAESVMDLISSTSEAALQSSVLQLNGRLSSEIRGLRTLLLDEIAYIEAALDDPEHISLDDYEGRLVSVVSSVSNSVSKLLSSADEGALIKNGIRTAIVGRPNVGKSSLLNLLSHSDRAIVTDIPGTTRDVLEETISLGEVCLRVMDTAGIRETDDAVEKIGVEKSLSTIDQADFIIFLIDGSSELTDEDREIARRICGKKAVLLLNKADLGLVVSEDDAREMLKEDIPIISVSAKTGDGIEKLKKYILDLFFHGDIFANNELYITNERQKYALSSALESLRLVSDGIANGMSEDLLSIDLMDAYVSLGKMIGEEVEDDLVETIFSKFCMGK